jgi:NAD(P)-dependent dehydrogenase (short-subunit alcohol dehydrogenase family)
MGKLEGKVAVITGGSSGMALASAKRFVEEGAYVFITGRRQEALDEAVKLIGRNVTGVRGDVSNLDDLDRLFDTVKREKGKIDVLYASAGTGEAVPLGEITEQHFDATFGLNTRGTLFTVQKALPLFNDGGSIFMTRVSCFGERFSWLRRVCGEQGGVALIRTHVAQRTEGQEYPGERAEPGADRHTDAGPSSHRGGEADVRIPDPAGKDGSS